MYDYNDHTNDQDDYDDHTNDYIMKIYNQDNDEV